MMRGYVSCYGKSFATMENVSLNHNRFLLPKCTSFSKQCDIKLVEQKIENEPTIDYKPYQSLD